MSFLTRDPIDETASDSVAARPETTVQGFELDRLEFRARLEPE